MRYLLAQWPRLKKEFERRRLFVFLDFDGTLSRIAPTPGEAGLKENDRQALKELVAAPGLRVAVVSGRSLADVKRKVGLAGIVYAGNHGLEIEGKGIKKNFLPPGGARAVKQASRKLARGLAVFKGVFVEDKGLTATVHYRLAKKNLLPGIKEAVACGVRGSASGQVEIRPGKMSFEIRPATGWDKGKAVRWLLRREESVIASDRRERSNLKSFLPVYIGDDITDEDAFRQVGKAGITVLVGKVKRGSAARYYLKNTEEVFELLNRITSLRGRSPKQSQ